MAVGYHSRDFHVGEPKKPGVRAREEQLAQALQDQRAVSELGPGAQGNVSATQAVARARGALKRQQRVAAGQPALED